MIHAPPSCEFAARARPASARLPLKIIMSVSPYGSPLPYGGWALSLAILLGGFVVAAGCSRTAETGRDTESTAAGAYHTDQEVRLLGTCEVHVPRLK